MAVSAPPRPVPAPATPVPPATPPVPRRWWRARWDQLRVRLRPARGRRPWTRVHLLLVPALLAVIAAVWTGDAWVLTCGFQGCPTAADIRAFRPSEGGRILDRSGEPMGRVQLVRRINVPLAAVPPRVRDAFVAIEDRRFYEHRGVDWRGGARALLANLRAGGVREGFSTITMQVVRNTFAVERQGERSARRKLLELRLSRLLEGTLTKDQILELYLNVIYLGNGVYGVEAASRDLFGRSVGQLTLAQAATLAALPKGPSAYTPRRFPARATRRRDLVLARMARDGYVSEAAAERASRESMRLIRDGWTPDEQGNSYALDAVRQVVDSIKEANGIESKDLIVTTTLDAVAQAAAERAVRRRAAAIGPDVEGAMVAIDPRTGAVRAMVGGVESGDDYAKGSFNRATGAHRQPGSAFKPFVYATALAAGMTPATTVDDEPIAVDLGHGQVWRPNNSEGHYLGQTTLREALAHSANGATVRVAERIGEPKIIQTARADGIVSPLPAVPSMVLGSVEVTPAELVAAYAPFANGGFRVAPRLVARVAAVDGTVLWTGDVRRTPAMDARDAFLLTSMLRSVVQEGTGREIVDAGVRDPVAGKTGTTNDGADVWFVGYTPSLVAGFWFGADNPRPLGEGATGGRMAAPAWADFYLNGWRERAGDWTPPAGLVRRKIDADNGFLANTYCPVVRDEWFKVGTEPTEVCPFHATPPAPAASDSIPGDEGPPPVVEGVKKAGSAVGRFFKHLFRF